MPAKPRPTHATSASEPDGIIAGSLLREIRRQLGYSQERMAETLNVELRTYQSWEHGTRPLSRIPTHRMKTITKSLIRLGAEAQLVGLLDTAIDVDMGIADILAADTTTADHPLASWVQTRTWHDLLAWGIAGHTPRALTHLGDVAKPRMSVPDRNLLLERLRAAVERTDSRTDAVSTLLRRQVYFVASWDNTGPGRDWLARMERRELGRLRDVDGWTPTWVVGRSLAVARAVSGDPEQLRHFIARQIVSDDQKIANLNYWANWAGEDTEPAHSDEFMRKPDLGGWRGTTLLRQLTDGLRSTNPYIDLTVHSIKDLLERRPGLLDDDPLLTQKLGTRIQHLLDHTDPLSDQARRELDQISYGTKMRRTA